jgi:hypothetical protein
MLPFVAARQTKVVICVSCRRSRDGSHEHVTAMTLRSPTGHEQRIDIADAVSRMHHPLGERLLAHSPHSGEFTELVAGVCPRCQEHPDLRLVAGGHLLDLPRCR